jgi:hypothetical protein
VLRAGSWWGPVLVVGWLIAQATQAMSAPAARQRVVLADPDLELHHAMEQALAPWHLQVIVDGSPPDDEVAAAQRADADTARFVVWRDGDQLVVYDRELGQTERRASRSGVLSPPTAAAAALTIKTMMRLPPPPPPDEPSTVVVEAPPPAPPVAPLPGAPEPASWLRIQAQISTRIARGDETEISTRFGAAAAIQPWASAGLRFGLAGDGGTSTSVVRASFKGAWREWSVVGTASWTYARAAWELEPHAGAGVRWSTLDGTEMNTPRSETATLVTVRGGLWARWRYTRWTFGAICDADQTFGTPTYSKTGTPAEIFQVPGAAIELGAAIAVDL